MFDLQTHSLPEKDDELRKLAIRMGYAEGPHRSPLDAFKADYKQKTERNRKMLELPAQRCLRQAGGTRRAGSGSGAGHRSAAGTMVQEVLGRYGFQRVSEAYEHLLALGDGEDRVSLVAAVPALPGRDRAEVAAGDRPDARSRTRRWST